MSKPKYIQFHDGTRAKVYKNARRRLAGQLDMTQSDNMQFAAELTSGLYEVHVIKETDEVLLVEKTA